MSQNSSLRVLTFNVAHGRGTAFHQAFVRNRKLGHNMNAIGKFLKEQQADIVALQEIEFGSWWNGRKNDAQLLADLAGYPHMAIVPHVKRMGLQYGTAILSKYRVIDSGGGMFKRSAMVFPKGFVKARIEWGESEVTVASIHLDFMSRRRRVRQVSDLEEALSGSRPLIVMGDFNSDWGSPTKSTVNHMATTLGLRAFSPETKTSTFPRHHARLDWILASTDLSLSEREVIKGDLSDHYAVAATINRMHG